MEANTTTVWAERKKELGEEKTVVLLWSIFWGKGSSVP